MHPSASVILFTTSTGFGYGLFVWLSLYILGTDQSLHAPLIYSALLTSLGLITFGLLSSTWHLGHPERAWRAMSQWRTSWLSREGVLAVLCYAPMMGVAGFLFLGWHNAVKFSALFAGILALLTVYATSMIYASLKPIPAWHNRWTILGYLAYAIMTGGILWQFIHTMVVGESNSGQWLLVLIVISVLIKALHWRHIRTAKKTTTAETATGLKGRIKQIDPPHSSANYLMKEMGFEIARKHALKLRIVTLGLGFVVPLVSLTIAITPGSSLLALICCAVGIISERYLFFAEAKHVVSLYYS